MTFFIFNRLLVCIFSYVANTINSKSVQFKTNEIPFDLILIHIHWILYNLTLYSSKYQIIEHAVLFTKIYELINTWRNAPKVDSKRWYHISPRVGFRLVFVSYLCIYVEIHSKIECIRRVDFYQRPDHYLSNQHSWRCQRWRVPIWLDHYLELDFWKEKKNRNFQK